MDSSKWFAAVACVILTGCGDGDPSPAGPPPPEVSVVTVQATTAELVREYPGRLRAWRTAEVRARVEGILERRLFEEGAWVAAGQPLFQIEDTTYRAALAAAEAELATARRNVDRAKRLAGRQLAAREVLDEAQVRYENARARLAEARRDLDNTRVPAPLSGRIGRARVTEGALVGRGEPTLLAVIEQIDPLYVDFYLNENELRDMERALAAGSPSRVRAQQARLILDDGRPFASPIDILFGESRLDSDTGARLMRARVANPERALLPGAFVRVRLPVLRLGRVLRVPQRAVRASGTGLEVLAVTSDDKVAVRAITTAGMDGADFLVVEGLRPGERVIVEGLQKVRPGAAVRPVAWHHDAAGAG